MKRPPRKPRRSGCPISIALEIFGDSWSLLLVRDLMFRNLHTFNEFLAAGEGIASNILTDRLAKLEAAGIVAKSPDETDARRFRYELTAKGIDLAPVLIEIVLWTARYEETDAPQSTLRALRAPRDAVLAGIQKEWQSRVSPSPKPDRRTPRPG